MDLSPTALIDDRVGHRSALQQQDHVLRLDAVSKRYGTHQAVSDVSLALERGKLLTLLGPSGCGKSTLLRMVAGFVEPSAGAIHIGGKNVTQLAPERRPTAMVFQSYALFPHMSVFDNVAFGLRLRKCHKAELKTRVDDALDLIKMREFSQRYPAELSGGQQQRVALARCLVIKPEILLLDEPFGALDRSLREEMQVELRKLQKRLGITMLVVTHDQDEAFILSDAIAVMNAGRIEQLDSPGSLYDRPATQFVAKFMGIPNIFAGECVKEQSGSVFHIAAQPGLRIPIPAPATVPYQTGEQTGHAMLALRPETLRLVAADDAQATFTGVLAFITMIGSRMTCEVAVGKLTVQVVVARSRVEPVVGQPVGICVDPEHTLILAS